MDFGNDMSKAKNPRFHNFNNLKPGDLCGIWDEGINAIFAKEVFIKKDLKQRRWFFIYVQHENKKIKFKTQNLPFKKFNKNIILLSGK